MGERLEQIARAVQARPHRAAYRDGTVGQSTGSGSAAAHTAFHPPHGDSGGEWRSMPETKTTPGGMRQRLLPGVGRVRGISSFWL